ncbi:P-loop containing nucleoside triphosphate hydrolase protein [Chlamydoabsidia padenii]|nr:P-loop containing nucleoside triphosphate hydrolase protein [Chlamydoabsidia padenii]
MSSWWNFGTVKKEQTSPTPTNHASPTQPFKTMSTAFRKGVQYNMKVVIRGDVMTGKSTLFNRLQGSEFDEEAYTSTPQLQVANIPWHYKDSNDIVKIEVWDVVDKAHNNTTKKDTGIKLEHNTATEQPQEPSAPLMDMALDASTVDVYRNAHAVLFIFDITKQWTFDYVNNALVNVPNNVAVLVLGNFMDKERVVTVEEIHATLYEHNKRRIEEGTIKPNLIRYVETSLKTGLGLKFIYEYLGVPFLQLMMETLRKQLELKATDILDLLETLDKDDDVPEHMQRRRGQDNFDQPSEPHLARQHEAMKMAWNEELQDIAADHEAVEADQELSLDRTISTPPPPTAPAKMKKQQRGSLITPDIPPPIVDQFDAGSLEDDWFGDDSAPTTTPALKQRHDDDDDDDDDDIPGNPMVARDEDVAAVEYYQERSSTSETPTEVTHRRRTSQEATTVMAAPDDDHSDDEEQQQDTNMEYHHHSMYQSPPAFKSELTDVWAAHGSGGINTIQSDSEDEDNIIRPTDDSYQTPTLSDYHSASFNDLSGGYEEISGASHDNPWYQPDDFGQGPSTFTTPEPIQTSTPDKKAKKKKKSKSAKTKTSKP